MNQQTICNWIKTISLVVIAVAFCIFLWKWAPPSDETNALDEGASNEYGTLEETEIDEEDNTDIVDEEELIDEFTEEDENGLMVYEDDYDIELLNDSDILSTELDSETEIDDLNAADLQTIYDKTTENETGTNEETIALDAEFPLASFAHILAGQLQNDVVTFSSKAKILLSDNAITTSGNPNIKSISISLNRDGQISGFDITYDEISTTIKDNLKSYFLNNGWYEISENCFAMVNQEITLNLTDTEITVKSMEEKDGA
jgi:hypothetical protein